MICCESIVDVELGMAMEQSRAKGWDFHSHPVWFCFVLSLPHAIGDDNFAASCFATRGFSLPRKGGLKFSN